MAFRTLQLGVGDDWWLATRGAALVDVLFSRGMPGGLHGVRVGLERRVNGEGGLVGACDGGSGGGDGQVFGE